MYASGQLGLLESVLVIMAGQSWHSFASCLYSISCKKTRSKGRVCFSWKRIDLAVTAYDLILEFGGLELI